MLELWRNGAVTPLFRKIFGNCFSDVLQPGFSLGKRTGHYHAIGLPAKFLNSAKYWFRIISSTSETLI
jgi:hypothetical protein